MALHHRFAAILSLCSTCAFASSGGGEELRLEARALWDQSVSENLRLVEHGSGIGLKTGELYEDDGPAAGYSFEPNVEELATGTWIKKELIIPNPSAERATLLVAPGGDLTTVINGRKQALSDENREGSYWQAYDVSPESLKQGKNEIVLYGEGSVWVARDDEFAAGSRIRTRHPNRSAKSSDHGKTWSYDELGPDGKLDGEYYVRLYLDHYQPSGSLTLPVLDAGNLGGQELGPPVSDIGPVHVRAVAEAGRGGAIGLSVRSGPSPLLSAKSWSSWKRLGPTGGTLPSPNGRYVQIRIDLRTEDPLHTPKLKRLIVEAAPKRPQDWTTNVRVVDFHNEEIVRSSIPFAYEPFDHPRLKRLREHYDLNKLVEGAENEMELLSRLAAWSSKQWKHPGHIGTVYPPWDALQILKPHDDGTPVGGFCQQYNLVFLQACESFGFVGRAVSIGPGRQKDKLRCGGHEVVEIWSNEHKKWVYIDGNMAWYVIDATTKIPLSLWQLRERQLQALRGSNPKGIEVVKCAQGAREWTGLKGWPPFAELRLIPRSNFLQEQSPLPLNQGMRGWFWTGHYVWTDDVSPAALLYDKFVSRRSNWSWTLNQAHYVLEATERPGVIRVHLDTATPNLETFLLEFDGEAPERTSSSFVWELQEGKNRLKVRPRNRAGRDGIASWIVLDYDRE